MREISIEEFFEREDDKYNEAFYGKKYNQIGKPLPKTKIVTGYPKGCKTLFEVYDLMISEMVFEEYFSMTGFCERYGLKDTTNFVRYIRDKGYTYVTRRGPNAGYYIRKMRYADETN